ncbi:MAG: outer membrane protein assembly factor BamD [Pelagibacteraceae bacterium]
MHKYKYLIIVLFFFTLVNCKGNKSENLVTKPEKIPELKVLFGSALNYYNKGQYRNALKLFKKVETRYSFSDLAPRATLMITYIYYQNGDYFNTLKFARKFQTLYPKNENIAYIDFLIAMTFYEQVQIVARDQNLYKSRFKRV